MNVSIATPRQNARLTFNGTAGQAVSAWTSSSTFPIGWGTLSLAIKKPDGTTLTSAVNNGTSTVFLDQTILPVTGPYTLVFDPAGTTTGTATLKLFTVTNVTGPIAADGTGLPVSLTTPGQNALVTFSGTAGQAVSAWTSSSSFAVGYSTLSLAIQKPDGTTLASAVNNGTSTVFLDQTVLPVTGTYTLVLDPAGATTGTATLKLFTVTNVTDPIAADGTGLPVSLTTPGQNAVLTFSGTAGQAVSAWTSSSTFAVGYNTLSLAIKKPDGTTLASAVNAPTYNSDPLGLWIVGISGTLFGGYGAAGAFSGGFAFTSSGDFGFFWGPSFFGVAGGGVSATGGFTYYNGRNLSDMNGPFVDVGGSAAVPIAPTLTAAAEYSFGKTQYGQVIQGGSFQVGGGAGSLFPIEGHAGVTQTFTHGWNIWQIGQDFSDWWMNGWGLPGGAGSGSGGGAGSGSGGGAGSRSGGSGGWGSGNRSGRSGHMGGRK